MKRLISCVLALFLLVSLPLTVAAAESSLVQVPHTESPLQNAVTNVALIAKKALSATAKATANPIPSW